MEIQEEKAFEPNIIYSTINILRKVTKFVKIVPFAYALIFIICMFGYMALSDEASSILDMIFYVSPIVCLTFIWLSYYLKLCNWYRLQVCLPMFPIVPIFIDSYLYEFGAYTAYINLSLTIIIFLLSLINTYFVFVRR